MVDARSFQDYGTARIGNVTWINLDGVLEEGRLNTSETAVVYSDDVFIASVVWFGLTRRRYDARIYGWQDMGEESGRTKKRRSFRLFVVLGGQRNCRISTD